METYVFGLLCLILYLTVLITCIRINTYIYQSREHQKAQAQRWMNGPQVVRVKRN